LAEIARDEAAALVMWRVEAKATVSVTRAGARGRAESAVYAVRQGLIG
jgi:hypothetical protein